MAVTNFIWDELSDNVLLETDENDVVTASYTNRPEPFGELISQERNGVTSFYHYDGEHSTRNLTDSNEDVTDTFIYTAYGEEVARTGTTTNPFGYKGAVGYYTNEETDDVYVRARTYEPVMGCWLSADPLGFIDGANLYKAYFVPNGIDPSGLQIFDGPGDDYFTGCVFIGDPPPCAKCTVLNGPSFDQAGDVPMVPDGEAQTYPFNFTATFKQSPETCEYCFCCEIRLMIRWNKEFHETRPGPPHGGFQPPDNTPDNWHEDRSHFEEFPEIIPPGFPTRYGHRDNNPIFSDQYLPDQANGCLYQGSDAPTATRIPAGFNGIWEFHLRVIDVCNGDRIVERSPVITVNWL